MEPRSPSLRDVGVGWAQARRTVALGGWGNPALGSQQAPAVQQLQGPVLLCYSFPLPRQAAAVGSTWPAVVSCRLPSPTPRLGALVWGQEPSGCCPLLRLIAEASRSRAED